MHSSRMRTAHSSSRLRGGGGHLPQCMLGYPPGVGLETPHLSTSPPQVWAWRPPARLLNLPPPVWALRPPQPDPSTSQAASALHQR